MMDTNKMRDQIGWKVWGGDRCNHCCNGDRCDDNTHVDRSKCPYCKGTGIAIWLKDDAVSPNGVVAIEAQGLKVSP